MTTQTASLRLAPPVDHGHARLRGTDMRVNGEPERWLVAARLSRVTKRDRERGDDVVNGIQTQDRRSTDWADGEGHRIVHVTRDRNVSGAVPPWQRPELGPWLTDPVKLVQYDGIVAYEVSRLSREYFDLAWLRKWAEANHKKLYVIKERLHWPDNRDGIHWAAAAERAYEERQDIIEKVTRELNALEEAGKLVGRPPFGYTSTGERYDRQLVPTEIGRKYIKLIYKHCIKGWSLQKIANWLIAEHVLPVSGVWWARSIAGLIRNPVYMGSRCKREFIPPDDVEEYDGKVLRYRYGTSWVEAPRWQYGKIIHRCKPLVDAAVWKQANDALSTRPNRGYSDPENRAMLSEAMMCPECEDSPMYRHRSLSKGRAYFYYRCYGRGNARTSCGNEVRVELVDQAVNAILTEEFNVPIMEHQIVYGNEYQLKAELDRIKFELNHLGSQGLDWEAEDVKRAELRAEHQAVKDTKVIDDRAELVATDKTYLEEWERTDIHDRGPWLASMGFTVLATRTEVTVRQADRSVTEPINEPEHMAVIRDMTLIPRGKCRCGCGTDIYGYKSGQPKKYVNATHSMRASRRRRAAEREAS